MQWESSYDPEIHGDPWHNNNPFVLEEYRKRVKSVADVRRRSSITGANIRLPISSFPTDSGNLLDKKQTTTRLHAKSLLPLQSLVYKADSPLLQLSRTDGGTHRRSKVNRRQRPGVRVRRRGPIVFADERSLEVCFC